MSTYRLGQPVTITDYLVRAELRFRQALTLADLWEDMPSQIVAAAQRMNDRKAEPWERNMRKFRVWMPASLYPALGWDVRLLTRTHPEPFPYSGPGGLDFPLAGLVTQRVQVQDGRIHRDYEEGATFIHQSSRKGYRVAHDVNRRPLLVLPSMIQEDLP
ncbi:hypothetical protein GCM10009592_14470 [Brachybacterium rhamnosum]|uniref:Uncharacterized protein n=1 Tax=Brachybacterium rhamnosum TaxID=173361 RepID=A0ABW4PXZ3_9MICO